ncbi:unnamed protein product [Phytomonas sp. EM1]|nr:unnamed protein product [Phytomonas sp. EM1]|eukprot:CCW61253.1 unnamed protein product [Phytomonas sp. isolate EM1]
MSSVEELKIVRLFRAYNTTIQLCLDRGYTIRHPSIIADAVHRPELFDSLTGLDYQFFLKHFVLTPEQSKLLQANKHITNEEDADENDFDGLKGAPEGSWTAMRNAMRLSCQLQTSGATESLALGLEAAPGTAPLMPSNERNVTQHESDRTMDRRSRGGSLIVFFSHTPVLTIREVQDYREKALKKGADGIIVVAQSKVSPMVRRGVQELCARFAPGTATELLKIQVFDEESLCFNVTRHENVPRHVVLSKEEALNFLTERKLNISQLPRILESDPVVQYFGISRGDIVKIIRESEVTGPYAMYRQVV